MKMYTSKVLCLPLRLEHIFWKHRKSMQKYCACHTKRLSTRYKTRLNVTKCHACHAKRSNATCETSKSDPFCTTYQRHSHSDLARTVANGCGRLRTVADVNATSSEHTLNLQTPRVKREPLLLWYDITINRQQIRELQPPNLTGNEVYHMGLPIIWYRIPQNIELAILVGKNTHCFAHIPCMWMISHLHDCP